MAEPFVSVIVPVYKDAERLKLCLDALAIQSWPREAMEVLVVDNGSPQPPEALLRGYPFARLLMETRRGSYAARNTGIRATRARILAFTDADCIPSRVWIEQGLHTLRRHSDVSIVGGAVRFIYRDPAHPTTPELYERIFGFNQRHNIACNHYSVTANLFTTRDVFDSVGLFDATLQSGGDQEWGRRAYDAGHRLAFDPEAWVGHPTRPTITALFAKRRRVTAGQCALARVPGPHKIRMAIKLAKFLPSLRYRLWPVLRASDLKAAQKVRLAGLVVLAHYVEYGQRLRHIRHLLAWRQP